MNEAYTEEEIQRRIEKIGNEIEEKIRGMNFGEVSIMDVDGNIVE